MSLKRCLAAISPFPASFRPTSAHDFDDFPTHHLSHLWAISLFLSSHLVISNFSISISRGRLDLVDGFLHRMFALHHTLSLLAYSNGVQWRHPTCHVGVLRILYDSCRV